MTYFIRSLFIWHIILLSLTVERFLNIYPRKCLGHSTWIVTAIYFLLLSSSCTQNYPELQALFQRWPLSKISHVGAFCFSLKVWIGSWFILTKNCLSLYIIDLSFFSLNKNIMSNCICLFFQVFESDKVNKNSSDCSDFPLIWEYPSPLKWSLYI